MLNDSFDKEDIDKLIYHLGIFRGDGMSLTPAETTYLDDLFISIKAKVPITDIEKLAARLTVAPHFIAPSDLKLAHDLLLQVNGKSQVATLDPSKETEIGKLLDSVAVSHHNETVVHLEALRDRLGKDQLNIDEWNALCSAIHEQKLDAWRRSNRGLLKDLGKK